MLLQCVCALDMQQQANDLQQRRHKKTLLITLLLTIAINFCIKWLDSNPEAHSNALSKVNTQTPIIMDDLLQILDFEEVYEGTWKKLEEHQDGYLFANGGIFDMRMARLIETRSKSFFELSIRVLDGIYVDDGALEFQFRSSKKDFQNVLINATNQIISHKNGSFFDGRYSHDHILTSIQSGSFNITQLSFILSSSSEQKLDIKLILKTAETSIELNLSKNSSRMMRTMILAVVMFIVASGTFNGLFTVVQQANQTGAGQYSLATVCIASMWDTVVCMALLVLAFSSQINLMLFLIPALLMCLVFTNLEPKLMILIFEAASNAARNPQRLLCKFNLLHYGSLFFVYPLILLANFRPFIFILASCIFIPQIYMNAITGIRPDLKSHYYRYFLLYRFLLLFYVRCFPYNSFRLKPDYSLGICCLLLLALQYGLLYMQKMYGPKKVIPRFLLPPRYEYVYEEDLNVEEDALTADCAICLTPLHSDPPQAAAAPLSVEGRIMRTPCQHRYHSACLTEWMAIKQNCPECRAQLPPYE